MKGWDDMALTPEQTLCKYLSNYLFDKTWNSTEAEYRGNIIARCLSRKSVSNRLVLDCGSIALPDYNSYYVYEVPQTALRGLRIRTTSWVRLGEYLNNNQLDLRVTTNTGKWLYRDRIFITGHPTQKAFLIAVNANMLKTIAGGDYDFTRLFLSVYYDSNLEGKLKSTYYYLISDEDREEFINAATNDNTVTDVVINGNFCQDIKQEQVFNGYYCEIIRDEDQKFSFEVDLTDEHSCRFYKSEMGNAFKYIIHIPKALNPGNLVYSHNTVDFFIYPTNGDNHNIKGRFIHRFDTRDQIGQLTHNDFWIGDKLIQAYMADLNTTDVKLRVIVRNHGKNQTLIEDCNYLNLLYTLDDDQILDLMEGVGPDNLNFWKASNLEQSIYMTLIFKSILDNPITVSTLGQYIDAIGYYNVLSVLCDRVRSGIIVDGMSNEFYVGLPVGLGAVKDLWGHLWIDGLKIDSKLFSVARASGKLQAKFVLDKSVDIVPGKKIVTEVFEQHVPKAQYIIPDETKNSIVTGTDKVLIYRVMDIVEDLVDDNILSKDYKIDYSYELMEFDNVAYYDNGTLVFKEGAYNTHFLVITEEISTEFQMDLTIDQIRGKLVTTGPVMISVSKFENTDMIKVPLIWEGTPMIFVNNKELAKDIDFSEKAYTTRKGNFIARVFHITNVQYFNQNRLINSADDAYNTWYDELEQKYHYEFLNYDSPYLICDLDKIKVNLNSATASSDLVYILDQDPEKYGTIYYPRTDDHELIEDKERSIYCLQQLRTGEYIISGLSIEYGDNHKVVFEYTTDKCFSNGTGFFIDKTLFEKDILLYYHASISMICADGLPITDINTSHYGYLSTDEDVRKNAFVYHRGICPHWLVDVLDTYGDRNADIERLGIIIDYLESLKPTTYPEFIVTDRSHHITSVIINKVYEDVLSGKLVLAYDADEKKMLNQIKEYLALIDEDPAMSGSSASIVAVGAGSEIVNTTYNPVTKFINGYNKGSDRVWMSMDRNLKISWYPKNDILNGRWVIESMNGSNTDYYFAIDNDGNDDPWNLVWNKGTLGTGNNPKLKDGKLNLRFIDIDPSYTEVPYSDINQYKSILQVMKGLFPEDSTKDGGI